MTFSPTLDEVAAIIADAMVLGMNAWMIITVDPEHLSTTLDFLLGELELHAQDLGASVSILEASQLTASTLPWAGIQSPRALVVRGLESLPVEQLTRLDLDRGRFLDGPTIVAVTTPEGASRLALHAPNLGAGSGRSAFEASSPSPWTYRAASGPFLTSSASPRKSWYGAWRPEPLPSTRCSRSGSS